MIRIKGNKNTIGLYSEDTSADVIKAVL